MVVGETHNRRVGTLTELRRGVLEFCVLASVRDRDAYAFEIVERLGQAGNLVTSEGTIYPLLARLRRNGLVSTTWRESEGGPPRRYYRLTDSGRHALEFFVVEWNAFRSAADAVLTQRGKE